MVLNDKALREVVARWTTWKKEPLEDPLVQPASVDLRLGPTAIRYRRTPLGWRKTYHDLSSHPLLLRPGERVLVHSYEYVVIPTWAGAFLTLKSSRAREGWTLSHPGWFDPGFEGTAVFSLTPVGGPLTLEYLQPFVQLVFWYLAGPPERDYSETGHYQGAVGAVEAVGDCKECGEEKKDD